MNIIDTESINKIINTMRELNYLNENFDITFSDTTKTSMINALLHLFDIYQLSETLEYGVYKGKLSIMKFTPTSQKKSLLDPYAGTCEINMNSDELHTVIMSIINSNELCDVREILREKFDIQ